MLDRVLDTTATLWGTGDVDVALANASVYLEAVGHVVVAWLWLEQALAAEGRTGDFYDGKRAAAQYFFRYELPRTGAAAGPAGQPGPHHARRAARLVLTRGQPSCSVGRTRISLTATCRGRVTTYAIASAMSSDCSRSMPCEPGLHRLLDLGAVVPG